MRGFRGYVYIDDQFAGAVQKALGSGMIRGQVYAMISVVDDRGIESRKILEVEGNG